MIEVKEPFRRNVINPTSLKESLSPGPKAENTTSTTTSVETVYRIITSKPVLRDFPEVRASYVGFILHREVYESDMRNLDKDVPNFLGNISPKEREALKNYLLSLDAPFFHYLVFEEAGRRLHYAAQKRSHLRGREFDLYDGYLFSLAAIGRVFRRPFRAKDPLTFSILVADFVLILTLLNLEPRELAYAYDELFYSMEAIREELNGMIFFPLDMGRHFHAIKALGVDSDGARDAMGFGKTWNLVPLALFKSLAPKIEGESPAFLRESMSRIFQMGKLP